ncbi:MAG: NAD-dependent epimerase/dehydratase family protein, partial [Guyparkeria sp.]
MPSDTAPRPIVLIGYGDIARRLAARLPDHDIVAVGRHTAEPPRGHRGGWHSVVQDLDQDDSIPSEATPENAIWVYLAPPAGLIYISTTGVYGDHGGNWVSESTPPAPGHDRGYRRLDAEAQCRQYAQSRQIPDCVLRVTGIYACERLPVEKVRQGTPVPAGREAPWSNRIHAEDLADILRLLVDRLEIGDPVTGVFNVSDNHPT